MNTKKFIQILAVSATALITACEEELTSFDYETPIIVTSGVSEATRAGYDNANLPARFVMDINQGSDSYNYSLVEMSSSDGGETYTPVDENLFLLWKGNSDNTQAKVKAMTIPYGLNAIDAENDMTIRVAENQTTDENVKASDLLGAKTNDGITIGGDVINIEFRHLLSKLQVNYTSTSSFTVTSIVLENTCVKSDYSYMNMSHVDKTLKSDQLGNITMLHDQSNTVAEAIFCPHTPTSTTGTQLKVTIRNRYGTTKVLTCPVNLGDNGSFRGGHKYILNIEITGRLINYSGITVKGWIVDDPMDAIANKTILWVGTSIPSDHPDFAGRDSYPTMIANATGCKIVNKAQAGSGVIFFPEHAGAGWKNPDNWTSPTVLGPGIPMAEAYILSATKKEIETKYTKILTDLANQKTSNQTAFKNEISNLVDQLEAYSYENLILPYINGTSGKTQCDVVVIDHGYNDMNYTAQEVYGSGYPDPLGWLKQLTTDSHTLSEPYKNWMTTYNYANTNAAGQIVDLNNQVLSNVKVSYIQAMNHIISEIKKTNSNVKIIIGNNFSSRTPYYRDGAIYDLINGSQWVVMSQPRNFGYFGDALVAANEAVARMNNLPIVNVYQHTGLNTTNERHTYYDQIYFGLCPDGIHPGSDPTGSLNKIIADIYVEAFKEIFN